MPREFTPESVHLPLIENPPRRLRFRPDVDFTGWKAAVREKLEQLLGVKPEYVNPDLVIEFSEDHGDFTETRFIFTSEAHADVPCHLLVPKNSLFADQNGKLPVVICLQGHSTGMHISLGRARYSGDEEIISGGDRDFALRAAARGYAAVILEQRCFGERHDAHENNRRCHQAGMTALLLGRTLIGERVWDVSRLIDVLPAFPELDISRLGIMGNSGGGTICYYAACMDERIRITMPSCSVCTLKASIGMRVHCECNYIPGILEYFETGDLACLITPRPLVIVAGRYDDIFPLDGVEESFRLIQEIYAAAGAGDRCRLVVGPEGHRFYADAAWPVFAELSGW